MNKHLNAYVDETFKQRELARFKIDDLRRYVDDADQESNKKQSVKSDQFVALEG